MDHFKRTATSIINLVLMDRDLNPKVISYLEKISELVFQDDNNFFQRRANLAIGHMSALGLVDFNRYIQ